MRKIAIPLILIITLLGSMGGCALAPPAPETMPQKLVYAYSAIEGLATSVESLYRADVITNKEATDAFNTLTKAYDLLVVSEKFYKAGKDGQDSLIIATNMLGVVRDFLLERSQKR